MVDRVQSSLSQFMHRNAIFLCERLCAEFPSELNLQLMATCYLRNNQPYFAYHILKGKQMALSRYLFALSCFQMNLLREAETALCPANEPNSEIPNGASGHHLLGLVYRYTGRRKLAKDHFMQALVIDPLFWAAYEELCALGDAEDANECFNDAVSVRIHLHSSFDSSSQGFDGASEDHNLPLKQDSSPRQSKQLHTINNIPSYPQSSNCVPSNLSLYNTPSPPVTQLSGTVPPPVYRNAYLPAIGGDGPSKPNPHATIQAPRRKFMDEGKLRKVSGRLFSGSDFGTRRSTRLSGDAMTNASLHVSQTGANCVGLRSLILPASSGALSHESGVNGAKELLFLLRILGEGYRLSCLYRCQDALEYFEADRIFDLTRRVSPCMLEGMDAYSTVLYHLKEDMKLSYLAQELISIDRLSPQAWCDMGNCYSLQRDHEMALKNFQRAIQLDSRFAYAHTLCGHEHIALEDYDNGIRCFHNALRVNERHYNSWYGLGVVFLRQEKFEFAAHNFREAYNINARSSIIMSYLGMALHSLKRDDEALVLIDMAIIADKKNPLPMYEKANVLVSLERYEDALKVLKQLIEFSPPRNDKRKINISIVITELPANLFNPRAEKEKMEKRNEKQHKEISSNR
ncbi:hypothetical protein KSP39_PZI010567 [Platanthera zijinensis]|uniref:Uncharacterized protein n=1 Tax=Platanthera zijinensis TaxID=2320716 RepID=A0AAP0BJC8_9ASPA